MAAGMGERSLAEQCGCRLYKCKFCNPDKPRQSHPKAEVLGSVAAPGCMTNLVEYKEVIKDMLKAIDDNDRWIGKTSIMLLEASKRAKDFLAK